MESPITDISRGLTPIPSIIENTLNTTAFAPYITPFKILTPNIFKYYSDIKVLICIECNTAVRSTLNIEQHIIKYHNSIKYDLIKQKTFEKYLNNLKTLDIIDYTLEGNIIPNNQYYFPDLTLFNNGYTCLNCNFITLNIKAIKRHCNTHGFHGQKGIRHSNKGYLINQYIQYLKETLQYELVSK